MKGRKKEERDKRMTNDGRGETRGMEMWKNRKRGMNDKERWK